jgi:hypothetical protein
MQVHHNNNIGPDPARGRTERAQPSRPAPERAEAPRAPKPVDTVDLSRAARLASELSDAVGESASSRKRVLEIIGQYRSGSLVTDERVQRAAEGLLSDI